MGRVRSLRSRATKDYTEELRLRAIAGYVHGYISMRRMLRLLAIVEAFEREAFLPEREALREINEEAKIDGTPLTRQTRRAMLKVLAGKPTPRRNNRG